MKLLTIKYIALLNLFIREKLVMNVFNLVHFVLRKVNNLYLLNNSDCNKIFV